jgi:16S rRNA G1207 methylase RsmC
MVANIALPYEGRLKAVFAGARMLAQSGGYKVYEAIR